VALNLLKPSTGENEVLKAAGGITEHRAKAHRKKQMKSYFKTTLINVLSSITLHIIV
jgi:hypothetical protein